jgi:hypothetical protein
LRAVDEADFPKWPENTPHMLPFGERVIWQSPKRDIDVLYYYYYLGLTTVRVVTLVK